MKKIQFVGPLKNRSHFQLIFLDHATKWPDERTNERTHTNRDQYTIYFWPTSDRSLANFSHIFRFGKFRLHSANNGQHLPKRLTTFYEYFQFGAMQTCGHVIEIENIAN